MTQQLDLLFVQLKRLGELDPLHVKRGDARECRITGSPCITWWPL